MSLVSVTMYGIGSVIAVPVVVKCYYVLGSGLFICSLPELSLFEEITILHLYIYILQKHCQLLFKYVFINIK
jgi:hypothetical protein